MKILKILVERGQPYFTPMVLKILSESPLEEKKHTITISYNLEIAIKRSLDMPIEVYQIENIEVQYQRIL